MKELGLGPLLAGDELYIVDENDVHFPEPVTEVVHLLVAYGVDEFVRKGFRRDVAYAIGVDGAVSHEEVAYRIEQMGLAESDAAVYEQRVVCLAGVGRHGETRSIGKLIARAHNEVLEGILRIELTEGRLLPKDDLLLFLRLLIPLEHIFDPDIFFRGILEDGYDNGFEVLRHPITEEGIGHADAAVLVREVDEAERFYPGFEAVLADNGGYFGLYFGKDIRHGMDCFNNFSTYVEN